MKSTDNGEQGDFFFFMSMKQQGQTCTFSITAKGEIDFFANG